MKQKLRRCVSMCLATALAAATVAAQLATDDGSQVARVRAWMEAGRYADAESEAARLVELSSSTATRDVLQSDALDLLVEALTLNGKGAQPQTLQLADRAVRAREAAADDVASRAGAKCSQSRRRLVPAWRVRGRRGGVRACVGRARLGASGERSRVGYRPRSPCAGIDLDRTVRSRPGVLRSRACPEPTAPPLRSQPGAHPRDSRPRMAAEGRLSARTWGPRGGHRDSRSHRFPASRNCPASDDVRRAAPPRRRARPGASDAHARGRHRRGHAATGPPRDRLVAA